MTPTLPSPPLVFRSPPPPPTSPPAHSLSGRHLYSIATGALLLAYPVGLASLLHLAAPAAAVYAVMRQIRPHAGTLAWTLAFSYLIWRHVAGASGGAWKAGLVDYTGALMVLTLKVIAGAVAYQDGLRLAAEEGGGEEGGGARGAGGAGGDKGEKGAWV